MTLLSALPPGTKAEAPATGALALAITNVRQASGTIWVGVYEAKDFLDREKARLVACRVNAAGMITVDIDGLVEGKEYALGLFHDLNDNGELDTNWLGLPAEPWAFSGRLRSKLRLPHFGEVSFVYRRDTRQQLLRLRKW
jgi:uncharacterized protein (DUF2141 family)